MNRLPQVASSATIPQERFAPRDLVDYRVAYIGDVPVENGLHGSAQLFRILENWRPENVRVVEFDRHARPALKLPAVSYSHVQSPVSSTQRLGSALFFLKINRSVSNVHRELAGFEPQAILSVAHGREWLIAYMYARRFGIPFGLIVHDAGRQSRRLTGRMNQEWITDKLFGHVYRHARARLCVSTCMEAEYRRRFGVAGDVLLPIVGRECPRFAHPRTRACDRPLRVAFAGTIAGLEDDLLLLATCLAERSGELLLYGGNENDSARLARALPGSLRMMPLFRDESELVSSLYREADAAYLPMTFDPAREENVRVSFPSKLTAYTAAGLPVLIRAPEYASIVQWAKDKASFGVVACDATKMTLSSAAEALDVGSRSAEWGIQSLELCERHFRHHSALRLLASRFRASD